MPYRRLRICATASAASTRVAHAPEPLPAPPLLLAPYRASAAASAAAAGEPSAAARSSRPKLPHSAKSWVTCRAARSRGDDKASDDVARCLCACVPVRALLGTLHPPPPRTRFITRLPLRVQAQRLLQQLLRQRVPRHGAQAAGGAIAKVAAAVVVVEGHGIPGTGGAGAAPPAVAGDAGGPWPRVASAVARAVAAVQRARHRRRRARQRERVAVGALAVQNREAAAAAVQPARQRRQRATVDQQPVHLVDQAGCATAAGGERQIR